MALHKEVIAQIQAPITLLHPGAKLARAQIHKLHFLQAQRNALQMAQTAPFQEFRKSGMEEPLQQVVEKIKLQKIIGPMALP